MPPKLTPHPPAKGVHNSLLTEQSPIDAFKAQVNEWAKKDETPNFGTAIRFVMPYVNDTYTARPEAEIMTRTRKYISFDTIIKRAAIIQMHSENPYGHISPVLLRKTCIEILTKLHTPEPYQFWSRLSQGIHFAINNQDLPLAELPPTYNDFVKSDIIIMWEELRQYKEKIITAYTNLEEIQKTVLPKITTVNAKLKIQSNLGTLKSETETIHENIIVFINRFYNLVRNPTDFKKNLSLLPCISKLNMETCKRLFLEMRQYSEEYDVLTNCVRNIFSATNYINKLQVQLNTGSKIINPVALNNFLRPH